MQSCRRGSKAPSAASGAVTQGDDDSSAAMGSHLGIEMALAAHLKDVCLYLNQGYWTYEVRALSAILRSMWPHRNSAVVRRHHWVHSLAILGCQRQGLQHSLHYVVLCLQYALL